MIRKLFLDDVVSDHELGAFWVGIQRIRQSALIVRVEGEHEPQLFLERSVVAPFAFGVQYVHLPDDGLDEIASVCATILEDSPPPSTGTDLLSAVFLRLCRLPILGFFLGFLAFWVMTVGATFAGVPFPEPSIEAGLIVPLAFGAFALHFGSIWVVSSLRGESMAASMTRLLVGPPYRIEPMGTYRGPRGKGGFPLVTPAAWLYVMAIGGSKPALVMARSHRHPLSAGVAVFRTPVEQIPRLLEAIAEVREQAP